MPMPPATRTLTLPLEDWLAAELLLLQGQGFHIPGSRSRWEPIGLSDRYPSYETLGEYTVPRDLAPLVEKRGLTALARYWRATRDTQVVLVTWEEYSLPRPEESYRGHHYRAFAVLDLEEAQDDYHGAIKARSHESALEAVLAFRPFGGGITPKATGYEDISGLRCSTCGGDLHWHTPPFCGSKGVAYCEESGYASRILSAPALKPPCPSGQLPIVRTPLGVLGNLGHFAHVPGT